MSHYTIYEVCKFYTYQYLKFVYALNDNKKREKTTPWVNQPTMVPSPS